MVDYENPVTLPEALALMGDDWRKGITNDFIRVGYFSKHIEFHSLRNPYTGGSGFTHRFTRLKNTAPVSARSVNEKYPVKKVDTSTASVDVKYWGGTFEMDRIIYDAGTLEPEIALQMGQLAKSCSYYFDQLCVMGDSGSNPKVFDGIVPIARAYGREKNAVQFLQGANNHDYEDASGNKYMNLFSFEDDKIKLIKRKFLFLMDRWLSTFDEKPTFLLGNPLTISCLSAIAREVGVYQEKQDDWGNKVEQYKGIDLVSTSYQTEQELDDTNQYSFTRKRILPTETVSLKEKGGSDYNNYPVGSLIAGRFGRDAIYGICPSIGNILRMWYPKYGENFVEPVQKGGVEMSGAMVVNKIESIGVLNNLVVGDAGGEGDQ